MFRWRASFACREIGSSHTTRAHRLAYRAWVGRSFRNIAAADALVRYLDSVRRLAGVGNSGQSGADTHKSTDKVNGRRAATHLQLVDFNALVCAIFPPMSRQSRSACNSEAGRVGPSASAGNYLICKAARRSRSGIRPLAPTQPPLRSGLDGRIPVSASIAGGLAFHAPTMSASVRTSRRHPTSC